MVLRYRELSVDYTRITYFLSWTFFFFRNSYVRIDVVERIGKKEDVGNEIEWNEAKRYPKKEEKRK